MDQATFDALEAALAASPDNRLLREQVMRGALALDLPARARDHALHLLRGGSASAPVKVILAEAYRRLGKAGAGILITEELFAVSPRRLERVDELLLRETHLRLLLAERRLNDAAQAYLGFQLADPGWAIADIEREVRLPPLGELTPDTLADPGDQGIAFLARPDVTFADVGGMEAVKAEIRMKIIAPLTNPELFAAYGQRAGGGILLYGPPGCGKTFLARATAGEVEASFLPIGLDDILSMWHGESERNLAARFAAARRHRPAVVFVDELDALAAKRRGSHAGGSAHTVNAFLHELGGIEDDNEGVLVLGATNLPWHVDAAFLRPGRFDRVVFVPPPDREARAAILELKLRGKPTDGRLDVDQVARRTADFSGADLAGVVERATATKLAQAMRSGRIEPLRTTDLLAAAKRSRPTAADWLKTARNYVLHANASGLYDDVATYLKL